MWIISPSLQRIIQTYFKFAISSAISDPIVSPSMLKREGLRKIKKYTDQNAAIKTNITVSIRICRIIYTVHVRASGYNLIFLVVSDVKDCHPPGKIEKVSD